MTRSMSPSHTHQFQVGQHLCGKRHAHKDPSAGRSCHPVLSPHLFFHTDAGRKPGNPGRLDPVVPSLGIHPVPDRSRDPRQRQHLPPPTGNLRPRCFDIGRLFRSPGRWSPSGDHLQPNIIGWRQNKPQFLLGISWAWKVTVKVFSNVKVGTKLPHLRYIGDSDIALGRVVWLGHHREPFCMTGG